MPNPAFLALGDIHLSPLVWLKYRNIAGDSEQAFKSFIDLGIELHLPLVLVGDIWDSVKPPSSMLKFFRQQVDRCQQECVAVYAIQGNHDKQVVPWYVAAHDHVTHLGDGTPHTIGGVNCVGFDYALKDTIQRQLTELGTGPLPQCLLLHQACRQALGFENAWNCDLEWVPEGVPLVVMGDIHIEWEKEFRAGCWAYYTSVSHARDISQRGPKTCLLVNDDLTVERLPIFSRQIGAFRCTAADQVAAAEAWLQQALATPAALPPAVWLYETVDMAAECGRVAAEWGDRAIVVRESLDLDTFTIDPDAPAGGEEVELLSIDQLLATVVNPVEEPEAYQFILDLIDPANSLLDTIRERRETFLRREHG